MKLTLREKDWFRALIMYWAILPILVLFSPSPQWIGRAGVSFWLLIAIGHGLLWLGLAVALAAVNRASLQEGRSHVHATQQG
jgi:hypothetical protein